MQINGKQWAFNLSLTNIFLKKDLMVYNAFASSFSGWMVFPGQ